MPYGTPEFDASARTYKAQVVHQTIHAGSVMVTLSFTNAIEEADTDDLMQEFLDLIGGSSNFAVTLAEKSIPSTSQITPN